VKRGGGGAFVERTIQFRATTRSARAISFCFESRCELGTIETPKWNLAVENQLRSGRAEGTPTLFRPFSPMNSGFGILHRLRRCEGFFRQEAGAKSEAILTHSICFDTKRIFAIMTLR